MPSDIFGFEIEIGKDVYFPREDSELALESIRNWADYIVNSFNFDKNARIRVLDMGSGTGILGIGAYSIFVKRVQEVHVSFVDNFLPAIENLRVNVAKYIPENRYTIVNSDLFSAEYFMNCPKFDVVIFNAPYLPGFDMDPDFDSESNSEQGRAFGYEDGFQDPRILPSDLCWYGGEKGYETTLKFLSEVPKFSVDGSWLFLTSSSLTEQDPILDSLSVNGFQVKSKAVKKVGFEEIIEYICQFSDIKNN